MKRTFKITGMDCPSCATLLECELEDAGIKAKVNFTKETLKVEDNQRIGEIRKIIEKLGYTFQDLNSRG